MQGRPPTLVDTEGMTLFLAMGKDTPKRSPGPEPVSGPFRLLDGNSYLVEKLFARSQATRWGLTLERFSLSLAKPLPYSR